MSTERRGRSGAAMLAGVMGAMIAEAMKPAPKRCRTRGCGDAYGHEGSCAVPVAKRGPLSAEYDRPTAPVRGAARAARRRSERAT